MSTGLKLPSFTCKCVFYTPYYNGMGGGSMKLNFEGFEMQK